MLYAAHEFLRRINVAVPVVNFDKAFMQHLLEIIETVVGITSALSCNYAHNILVNIGIGSFELPLLHEVLAPPLGVLNFVGLRFF